MTAAVASQICGGASAVLLASEQRSKTPRAHAPSPHPPHQLPRRRLVLHAYRAHPGDPLRPGKKTGLSIDDDRRRRDQRGLRPRCSGLAEVQTGPTRTGQPQRRRHRVGHPLGATGAKLFATMLNELRERTGGPLWPADHVRAVAPPTSPSSNGCSPRTGSGSDIHPQEVADADPFRKVRRRLCGSSGSAWVEFDEFGETAW